MKKSIPPLRGVLAAALALAASPLATAQFADGLVAYWPLDGDLLDSSDTGADGTFIPGTGDPELRFAPGQFGDGINLNDFAAGAFEQYITIDSVTENTFDFAGGSMTVSLWASTPFLSIDNQAIVAKGTGSSWSLSRSASSSTAAFHGGGSTAAGDPVINFIDDTLMHHLVGVVEAGVGVRLYLDGQLVGAANGNIQLGDGDSPLAIGGNPGAEADLFRTWEGVIDDVAIWNRALSAGEIATLFNGGTGVSVADVLNPVDTDEDGMPDFYENTNGLDPNVDDAGDDLDGDGLTNLEEFNGGTNPQSADTDDDGLSDADEINIHSTDPVSSDSDADGLSDGDEVNGTLNPFLDGTLRDPFEPEVDPAGDSTDPNSADSDSDDFDDRLEIEFKSNPNDPEDSPSRWQIGLKGYWPLDKGSYDASGDGSFPDASGRGFPGKLAGESTNPLWFNSPFYPQVVRLNGTDQRIEIQGDPDEFAMAAGDLTVSAWFVTPSWGKNWQAVVAKGEGNNWRVHRNGGNSNMAFAGGRADISGGLSVADFQWHHVVAQSENGVGTRLFVDGQQVAVGSGSDLSANGQSMMIGGNPDTAGDNFRTIFGAIAEVAVWERVLSAAEVSTIWNGGGGATIEELIVGLDTDGDGMIDIFEDNNGLDKDRDDSAEDLDDDGLTNLEEYKGGTPVNDPDVDSDDLNDGDEFAAGTNPFDPDSDDDGLTDGAEVVGTQNPFLDGVLRDGFTPGVDPPGDPTDPLLFDTDGDAFGDRIEFDFDTDPNDPTSFPDSRAHLVAHYEFEDPDNLGLDSSGLENHATTVSNVTQVEGQVNQAAFFNEGLGSVFRINGGLNGFTGTGGRSYVAWVKLDSARSNFDGIISQDSGGCCGTRILFHADNKPYINLTRHIDRHMTGAPALTRDEWAHVAMVGEDEGGGSVARVYINGEEVGVERFGNPMLNSSTWNTYLGVGESGTAHRLTGALDDVRIYEGPLTRGEIVKLMDPSDPPTAAVLIIDLRFNGAVVEVDVEALDAAKSYLLRRTTDGENFTDIGTAFTGADTNTFMDPDPLAGTALYQIWETP